VPERPADPEVTRSAAALPRASVLPLLSLLLAGLTYYGARGALANFVLPWEHAYGASRGGVSLIVTASFLSIGAAQIVGGRLLERMPAWKVLAAGLVLGVLGYGAGALVTTLPLEVLLVGVVAGFGGGLAANSTLSVMVTQLYRERHGALFGLIGAATAAGSVVMLPSSRLALDVSLRTALLVLAATILLALVGVVAFLRVGGRAERSQQAPVSVASVMRQRDFWLLGIPFFICGVTSTGITDTHFVAYVQGCHIGGGTASTLAATLALFNLVGTFGSGLLTDRINPRRLLAGVYLCRGLVLLVLPLLRSPELIAAFAVTFGLADFSTVPPTTALAQRSFRSGGFGLVLGLIGAAHQVGSALGSEIGGLMYDATGGYGAFFVSAAGVCVIAAVLSLGVDRPDIELRRGRRTDAQQPAHRTGEVGAV
jgi:predicted MFS family arabinose efflux permease